MARKKKKNSDDAEDEMTAEDLGIPAKETAKPKADSEEKESSAKKTTKGKKSTAKKKSSKKTSKKKSTKAKPTSKKAKNPNKDGFQQSETNVGLVGHVDHGKTTLVSALSGVWTERYADEVNRGITIKLGYAEAAIMQCVNKECESYQVPISLNFANKLRKSKKDPKGHCPVCFQPLEFSRRISFVDAPGHEILMATMLSGASLMDGAVLLIAANEDCPQPQTREHLAALDIAKIENIIIVQNKVDAVGKERALEHYRQIKKFIKGTIAEKAPIIPVSAIFDANVDLITQKIEEVIPTPELDEDSDFLFNVARSFDVNKPGSEIEKLSGGVIGGSIVSGCINVGDEVEIRPGLKDDNGKYRIIKTKVTSIYEGTHRLESARPGGLIALGTELDPSQTRTDQLIGSVAGTPETLPEVLDKIKMEAHLLDKVLGAEEEILVEPIKPNELLMIVVGTMTSAGVVEKIGKNNTLSLNLKRPICALEGSIIAISRRIKNRFRLIGYGYLI